MTTYTPEQQAIRLAMLQDMSDLMNASKGVSQEAAGSAVAQQWGGKLTPSNQIPVVPQQTATQKYVGQDKLIQPPTESSTWKQAPGGNVPGFPQSPPPLPGDMDYNIDPSAGLVPILDGAPAYTDSAVHDMYRETDPYSELLRSMGISGLGMTPYDKWYTSQFDPMYAAFGLGLTPSNSWADAITGGLNPSSARSLLGGYFSGLSPEQERIELENMYQGLGVGGTWDALESLFTANTTPMIAKYMASPAVRSASTSAFGALSPTEQRTTGFLDYLKGLVGGGQPTQPSFGDNQQKSQIPLSGPYNQQPAVDQAMPGAPPSQAMIDIARNQTPAYDYINGQWARI